MKTHFLFIATILCFAFLSGCAGVSDSPRRVVVSWDDLPGWRADDHAAAVPVFLRSCETLRGEEWKTPCAAAARLSPVSSSAARQFFETHFLPHRLLTAAGGDEGLITGYYEPLLRGAFSPSARYQYPVYARPDDLLRISLGDLYPSLQNKRLRGRVQNGEVVPYYSRAEIDGENTPLAGDEILWVDDKHALFFLHIQGSGLVQLPDGEVVGVGYRDQNGHPYRSIGKLLVARGEMQIEEVNLFSLRDWLRKNPARADDLLNENPSYVFFSQRAEVGDGPIGALGVMLTPERSLAADFTKVPRGAPVWLATTAPDNGAPLQKLMFAQDSGGAIKGDIRADFFWGRGDRAETMAGLMKSRGKMFVLLPR